jgi:hypothetical protein
MASQLKSLFCAMYSFLGWRGLGSHEVAGADEVINPLDFVEFSLQPFFLIFQFSQGLLQIFRLLRQLLILLFELVGLPREGWMRVRSVLLVQVVCRHPNR